MVRSIIAVVVGYVVMALLVFVLFTAAYLAIGAEGAFVPGSYAVSGLWIVLSFVLSLVAAIVGGYACAAIARGGRAPLALAVLVIVLGMLAAIPVLTTPGEAGARAGDLPNMEAMMRARQPAWVALLLPLVGAAGVVVGSRLRRDAGAPSS